jgi:hypothetical protein
MKKWTHRDARSGNTVSPDGFNDEFRAQQSSITTIDRDQIPASFVDEARLEPGAILRTYADDQYPAASDGQQDADADTSVASNMWIASTFQVHAGGWTNVGSTITLSNFGGGSLFFEWSCNAYVSNIFARGANDGFPGSPAYMRLRILVNGVTLAERRGTAYHEHSRLFGTDVFAPGDLSVDLQFRLTEPSEDCAWSLPSGDNLLQAHIYSSRYFAVGRFR